MRPSLLLAFVLSLSANVFASSPRSQVDIDYVDSLVGDDPITDNLGEALPIGTVVQLGYFSGLSLMADPSMFGPAEWATFTPLAGDGSLNPSIDLRIGDGDGVPAGLITTSVTFDTSLHLGIPIAPQPGLLAAIRFFDQSTEAGSGFYNTVSAPNWIIPSADWPPPVPPVLSMEPYVRHLLVWESGDSGFATTLPFNQLTNSPEPSVCLLALLGIGALARRRR